MVDVSETHALEQVVFIHYVKGSVTLNNELGLILGLEYIDVASTNEFHKEEWKLLLLFITICKSFLVGLVIVHYMVQSHVLFQKLKDVVALCH